MRQLLALIGAALLSCACASAGPVLDISPPDITAWPGGTASWNFQLYNDDTQYDLVVDTGSFLQQGTPLGTFTPVISSGFYLVAPGETWKGVFGTYTVDAGAVPFAVSTGPMNITYDVYDPLDFSNPISTGNSLDSVETASITVSATPEPATAALLLAGLCGLLLFRRPSGTPLS